MTTDPDALIAEAWDLLENGSGSGWESDAEDMIRRLADALESTLAELRQERERADELRELSRRWQEVVNAPGFVAAVEAEARGYHDSACRYQATLSRAEEAIDRVLSALDPSTGDGAALDEARTILTEYGKQKGADHANVSEVPERLNCPGEVKVKVQSEPTGALSDYLRDQGFNPNRMGNWDTGSGVGLAREAFLAGWAARERGV